MKDIYENIKPVMALLILLLAFGFLFSILFVFQTEPQLVGLALGAVISALSGAIGYYFGSSQGLAKANEQIAQNASNPVIQNSENTTVKK